MRLGGGTGSPRSVRNPADREQSAGLSHRAIAQACTVGLGTVTSYLQRAAAAGLAWPLRRGAGSAPVHPAAVLVGPPSPCARLVAAPPTNWTVRFQAEGKDRSGGTVRYVIEGRLQNLGSYHRVITGTWSQGAQKGELKITRN